MGCVWSNMLCSTVPVCNSCTKNKQTETLTHSHLGKELSQGNEEDFMAQHKTTIRTKCVAFCPTFKADNCIEVGGGGILTEGINDEVNE